MLLELPHALLDFVPKGLRNDPCVYLDAFCRVCHYYDCCRHDDRLPGCVCMIDVDCLFQIVVE